MSDMQVNDRGELWAVANGLIRFDGQVSTRFVPDAPSSVLTTPGSEATLGFDSKGNKIVVGNGVMIFNEGGLDNAQVSIPSTGTFHLEASPNPTSQFTRVTYDLPEAAHVTIYLTNGDGQIVRTILDENQDTGIHQIHIQFADLASGLYHLSVNTTEDLQSIPIILTD